MNSVILTIRINEEVKKELDMLALEDNRSLNNFVNTILIRYLNENRKEKEQKKINLSYLQKEEIFK